MVVWAYVDEQTNYLTGWTENKPLTIGDFLIEFDIDSYDFDIRNQFFACKYDKENDKIIFDENKFIETLKENKEYELRELVVTKVNEGFPVNINNKNLIFKPTPTNRAFLEQAYSLFTNKIIGDTTLPFVNENGEEALEKVVDSNIFEVWLLAYVNEEDMNKHLNNVILPKLKKAKTVEEIEAVEW